MSRTVLFSEVDEVAGRFPDFVAEFREVFVHARLPEAPEEILPAVADRIATDAMFREDLASMVATVCALEPQISHLEVLGILVLAAVGAEQARVLTEAPGVDLSARHIFNFVLETRRKRRDIGQDEVPADAVEIVPDVEAVELPPPTADLHTAQPEEIAPVVTPEVKPLAAATLPGDLSMLARALALAAEEEVPVTPESPIPPPAFTQARAVEEPAPEPVRPLRFARPAERMRPTPAPVAVEDDLEAEEAPPRRWGMWTAAACGVLLGFGLGVFAHFDHGSASPALSPSATLDEPASVGVVPEPPKPAPVKHMTLAEELRADLALLGRRSSPARPAETHVAERAEGRATVPAAAHGRAAHHADATAADQRPTLIVRSTQPNVPGTSPSGSSPRSTGATALNGPAPLVAAARPVNLAGAGEPGSSAARSAAAGTLPHVTTGSAGVMAANLISSPAPAYPVAASAAGVQGEVIVEAVVGRDGGVVDTRIVSGPLLLRAAALDAVQRWHYRPYEVDGKPIEVATTARLEFRLDR